MRSFCYVRPFCPLHLPSNEFESKNRKRTKSKLFYCLVFQSAIHSDGDYFPGRADRVSWDNYNTRRKNIVDVLQEAIYVDKEKVMV